MRSSATAGLTPQQLLDRRRAQNKLAQRRFREKARMARAAGNNPTAAFLAATTAHPSFPAHFDLTAPTARTGQPRVRSASSDSACSSSSASTSSQVSSPTSTCTELSTPTMPSFHGVPQPDVAFSGNIQTPSMFTASDAKPELSMRHAAFSMPPPPAFLPSSYAPFDTSANYPVSSSDAAFSEPLTYSSLAASSVAANRNTALKSAGVHSDPFLMSQPLPSPSLLLGTPANLTVPSNVLLFASHGASEPWPQETQHMSQASFENLLRIPSRPSTCSNASDAAASDASGLSPPLSSAASPVKTSSESVAEDLSYLTDAFLNPNEAQPGQHASSHLDKAISDHVARSSATAAEATVSPITIASQPFARVVATIGDRFGLGRNGEGLSPLLSRLQLCGKPSRTAETRKGLVFDANIDWEAMGPNMLPTTEQLLYPHRAFLDACLPWPAVRSRLLKHALTSPVCEEELAFDLLLSVLSSDEALSSFHVYGDDILDPEAWELSERMLTKWWGLFDDSVIRRTNWWRRQRGLQGLVIPSPSESANEAERQGLGTGSLDQVHRLAATLVH